MGLQLKGSQRLATNEEICTFESCQSCQFSGIQIPICIDQQSGTDRSTWLQDVEQMDEAGLQEWESHYGSGYYKSAVTMEYRGPLAISTTASTFDRGV